jgi:hypothetical protein
MEINETLDKAVEILFEKNIAKGYNSSLARMLALSAMYGMLSNNVSKKQAKIVLQIAEEWQ